MNNDDLREGILKVIHNQNICVLATSAGNSPHTSLMAYVCDEECKNIYMLTHRDSKKFNNICDNSAVSLLVDTRLEKNKDNSEKTRAVTISGRAVFFKDPEQEEKAKQKIVLAHENLVTFANQPQAITFSVQICSFQMLTGVDDSVYLVVDDV